jgi:hypothetical protein
MAKTKREQANDDPVAYLKAAGWKQLSLEERATIARCWLPPESQTGKQASVREVVLPAKRRNLPPRVVVQQIAPASTWYYTLDEAVQAQLQVDANTAAQNAKLDGTLAH